MISDLLLLVASLAPLKFLPLHLREKSQYFFFLSMDDSLNSEFPQMFRLVNLTCLMKRWVCPFIPLYTWEPKGSAHSLRAVFSAHLLQEILLPDTDQTKNLF